MATVDERLETETGDRDWRQRLETETGDRDWRQRLRDWKTETGRQRLEDRDWRQRLETETGDRDRTPHWEMVETGGSRLRYLGVDEGRLRPVVLCSDRPHLHLKHNNSSVSATNCLWLTSEATLTTLLLLIYFLLLMLYFKGTACFVIKTN